MGEWTAGERDAAHGFPGFQNAFFGDDALGTQALHQQVEAAELEVGAEDGPHALSLGLIDGDLAILGVVTKWGHAADPEALAFGGSNLVADPLGRDLALEL